jgi:hypothetical protein
VAMAAGLPTRQRAGRPGGAGLAARRRQRAAGGAGAPGPALEFEEKRFAFRPARCRPSPGPHGRGRGAPLSLSLQPPQHTKRGVLAASTFPAARTPPGVTWGVRAAAGGHDARRSRPTMGHAPWTAELAGGMTPPGRGRLYSAEAQRPRTGGGVTPAGAGPGRWARRGAPASRTSCPEMESAGVFLPAQIVLVLAVMEALDLAACYGLVTLQSNPVMLRAWCAGGRPAGRSAPSHGRPGRGRRRRGDRSRSGRAVAVGPAHGRAVAGMAFKCPGGDGRGADRRGGGRLAARQRPGGRRTGRSPGGRRRRVPRTAGGRRGTRPHDTP